MKFNVSGEHMQHVFVKAKPFLGVVFLQLGLAGMDIITKAALNQGMSNYVFVVYRHAIATIFVLPFALALDKKTRPKMTTSIFAKIMLLSLLEPIIDQNLFFLGMKLTTATFAAAMSNVLPAITFVMACFLRLENINLMDIRSQAKIAGTVTTVVGAMIMTLVQGPIIHLPWSKEKSRHSTHKEGEVSMHHSIKGAIMMTVGCFCWSCFMILQAITLQTYPAELSLTAWICFFGTIEGAIVALVMEKEKTAWSLKWDIRFFAAAYTGIICSGISYYVQGVVMKERGPVFVTSFSPLSMVIVAIMSSFILAELMYLGRIIGAFVIILGLYLVVWGKKKDMKPCSNEEQLNTKEGNSNLDIIAINASG